MWFCENNKRLFLPSMTPQFDFFGIVKINKNGVFLHILDFTFLWFCENQYKFYFFHVLMTSIFVVL